MVRLLAADLAAQTVVSSGTGAVDWAVAGGILVGAVVVGRLVQLVVLRSLRRGDSERLAADAVARMIALLVVLVALLWSLSILGIRLGPLVGALGVGGIALAFAAQAILANFLGSIILQLRRPFRRGDQIATGTCEGTVEDVNFRTVVLRTFDGERVLVPCTSVLANPITNHTALGRPYDVACGCRLRYRSRAGSQGLAGRSRNSGRCPGAPCARGVGEGLWRVERRTGHPGVACA
jgi:small-conductance mechanosensitive channel